MDLKVAIQKAARFAPSGKDAPDLLKAVRLCPGNEHHPSRLFATGGHVGVILDVEAQLPAAVLPLAPLKKALKGAKSVDGVREVASQGGGRYEVFVTVKTTGETVKYEVNGWEQDKFPGFPSFPPTDEMHEIDWPTVAGVLHCAGSDPKKPEFQVVAFAPYYVQSTDNTRLARAYAAYPFDGYVPVEVFRGWPRGRVLARFDDTYAWFRTGGELRYAVLQRENKFHPRMDRFVPRLWRGARATVSTEKLEDAVKRALDVSPWKSVALDFGAEEVVVRGYKDGADSDATYEASVPALISLLNGPVQLLVNGKYLAEALKAATTPAVRLGFVAADQPLRIESGPAVQVVWPSPA